MPHPAPALLAVGETMALLAPETPVRLADADLLRLDVGGAEANVAVHVAALGHRAEWYGNVGDDALGARVVRTLTARGVDTGRVVVDATAPTGLYLKDPGQGVLYFRAGSAASRMTAASADALELDGVRILHVSGITAALGEGPAACLERIMTRGRAAGALVSFDVNHRPALWSATDAAPALARVAEHADIVFVGLDEAETLWGCRTPADVRALLPGPSRVVVKDGATGATEFGPDGESFEPAERVDLVEPVGAGDAFAGGYLAAELEGASTGARLRAGHRRAALVLGTTRDLPDPVEETP